VIGLFRLFGGRSPQPKEGNRRATPVWWCFLPSERTDRPNRSPKPLPHPESLGGALNWVSSYFGPWEWMPRLTVVCHRLNHDQICLMNSHSEPARPEGPGRVSVEAIIPQDRADHRVWWQSAEQSRDGEYSLSA